MDHPDAVVPCKCFLRGNKAAIAVHTGIDQCPFRIQAQLLRRIRQDDLLDPDGVVDLMLVETGPGGGTGANDLKIEKAEIADDPRRWLFLRTSNSVHCPELLMNVNKSKHGVALSYATPCFFLVMIERMMCRLLAKG